MLCRAGEACPAAAWVECRPHIVCSAAVDALRVTWRIMERTHVSDGLHMRSERKDRREQK